MTDSQKKSVDSSEQSSAESSLATMQVDMEKALQAKQQAEGVDVKPHSSNLSKDDKVDVASTTIFDEAAISRVIEMAWEDRTPFSAIEHSYGLSEDEVIKLMRQELKPSSFRMWRKRVTGRDTKHQAKRSFEVGRAYCKTQYKPR